MAKKKNIKPVEQDRWEDEKFIDTASVLKNGKTEGVSIRTAKKYPNRDPIWRKSFWIQKDQKVNEILDWLFFCIKKFFAKFWGGKIITQTDIQQREKHVEELREQLRKIEEENRLLKEKYQTQQKELELAYEVIDNFDEYKKILDNFETEIKKSVSENKRIEEWIKNEIKEHRWILGLDCEVKAKNKDIDTESQMDLHIITNYGEDRVIEVKSPNVLLFSLKQKRIIMNPEIVEGLNELIEYLQKTSSYSLIKLKGTYQINKPLGIILAGFKISQNEKRILDDWNFYLGPCIKIVTFKDLIENARKEIEIIKFARTIKEK